MYSFDNTDNQYKYESIQHGYEVLEYEDETEEDLFEDISEEEFDEEFAM